MRAGGRGGTLRPRVPGLLHHADSVDPTRIRVYERWESEANLLAFRGSGPSDAQQTAILDADVKRYEISSVGEA